MGQHSKQEAEDAVQIDQQTVQDTGQFAFEAEVDQHTGQPRKLKKLFHENYLK